jgi:hypothetical protein
LLVVDGFDIASRLSARQPRAIHARR